MNNPLFRTLRIRSCGAVLALVSVAACQAPPAKTLDPNADAQKSGGSAVAATASSTAKVELPPVDYGRVALQDGVDSYRRGEFAEAYRQLQESPEIEASSVETRVEALKFLAFSACAQNKRAQCRQAFDKLLVLQPTFELKDAESKHPVWGPIFKQARQQQQADARKK